MKKLISKKMFVMTPKHLTKFYPMDHFWQDPEALYNDRRFHRKKQAVYFQKGVSMKECHLINQN
ncbi:hypothetical protein EBZ35_04395 [bacterium]|nr:hypothetical protein [bacterium]